MLSAQVSQKQTGIFTVNSITALNRAFVKVRTGDKIIISSGEYVLNNNLIVSGKSGITIIGEGAVTFLVKSPLPSCISIINSSSVTLKNLSLSFTIQKAGTTETEGIYLENADSVLIDSCHITGFTAGIYSFDSRDITIKASTLSKNTQWAVYGNYKNLILVENDMEHNGGLFFINGKIFHSVGITTVNVSMKNNWANGNGSGITGFMPIPFRNKKETVIPSPFSQETETDKKLEEGITGSSLQEDLDREFQLKNRGYTDQYLENSDLY